MVPKDATDPLSRCVSVSLSTQVSFKQSNETVTEVQQDPPQILSETVLWDQQDAIVTINQFQIRMINRHLLEVQEEETFEALLEPSRLTVYFDQSYTAEDRTTKMNAELLIEPFLCRFGFHEMLYFMELQEVLMKFLDSLNDEQPQAIPMQEDSDDSDFDPDQ